MAFAYTKLMQAMSEVGIVKDPDFEYVTLLLPGNGTNGAQNNTFLDSSTNNFTITRNGNTTQGTFSPYGDNWSNYFDGTGDNLSLATMTAVGNSNTTIEFFIFPTDSSVTYRGVFDSRSTVSTNTGFAIFQYGLTIEVYGASLVVSSAASALTINQWNHVAITRSSGTCQIYINGSTSGSSATYSSNLTSTVTRIGDSVNQLYPYVGYISNLRVVVGSVVYSGSTYTVPTAPLTAITNTSLLTCQSNRFIDNSTNAFAITVNGNTSVQRFSPFSPSAAYASGTIGGSGYFDGTGDYLSIANNTALKLTTGDWTIEFWIYCTGAQSASNNGIWLQDYGVSYSGIAITANSSRQVQFTSSTSGTTWDYLFQTIGTYTDNTWNHIAITKSGSTVRGFFNGVIGLTINSFPATVYSDAVESTIGRYSSSYFAGYISNLRIVKGTAVYTAAFTPPSAPVTAITNTSLLCNMTNAGIIDNAMMNDLETVGNAQISTTQSKFGGSSMYFDGTGDYLTIPSSQNFNFGTGNFTVEFWYRTSSTATATVIDNNYATAPNFTLQPSSGAMVLYLNGSATALTESSTHSVNVWYHYAFVRNGSTVTMYRDGTSVASATYSGAVGNGSVATPLVMRRSSM